MNREWKYKTIRNQLQIGYIPRELGVQRKMRNKIYDETS